MMVICVCYKDFDWKRIKFNMTNVHWQQEFLDLNGLDLLFYALGKQILSLKYRSSLLSFHNI